MNEVPTLVTSCINCIAPGSLSATLAVILSGRYGDDAKRQEVSAFVQRWPSSRPSSSSCSLLVQHCLVEIVAGDLLQEIAGQSGDRPAHRLRGLTQ